MIVFKISTTILNYSDMDCMFETYSEHAKVRDTVKEYNGKMKDGTYFIVNEIFRDKVEICAVTDNRAAIREMTEDFISFLGEKNGVKLGNMLMEEEKILFLANALRASSNNDFIFRDECEHMEDEFNLFKLERARRESFEFDESMIDEATKEELLEETSSLMFSETLVPEIERIFTPHKKRKIKGNPVQYLIQTSDRDARKKIYRALLKDKS